MQQMDSQYPQKRRRVTRACDECRRKKVKCDGKRPCVHCTVYSYECTYDQPSSREKRPRKTDDQNGYAANLAKIVALLMPELNEEELDADTFNQIYSKHAASGEVQLTEVVHEYLAAVGETAAPGAHAAKIFVGSVGKAGLGREDYEPKPQAEALPKGQAGALPKHSNVDESPVQTSESTGPESLGTEIKIILPPKEVALKLIYKTYSSLCILFRFYHRSSFLKHVDELYSVDPADYNNIQQQCLPFLYAIMAVGALFCKNEDPETDQSKFWEDEGYRYFLAARKLIDLTDARDMYAVQTIVALFLFLQCSARLSTCYSYIGVALRTALREGMHRNVVAHNMSPVEIETRKRLFYTIYKMDVYVNTTLGMPRSISQQDFDQLLPVELDDDFITDDGYDYKGHTELNSLAIANHHTKLIMILDHVNSALYSVKAVNNLVSHDAVSKLEAELRVWEQQLPKHLQFSVTNPSKANMLLHMAFLHVQTVLYRPFIHYISPKRPHVDPLSVHRAKNCLKVARAVVTLANEMADRNILSGSYWFSIYTVFFSVAGLIYYIHEVPYNEFDTEYMAIRRDALLGKNVLIQLKESSMASRRTYTVLNSLFDQLNKKTLQMNDLSANGLRSETISGFRTPITTGLSSDISSKVTHSEQYLNLGQDINDLVSQPVEELSLGSVQPKAEDTLGSVSHISGTVPLADTDSMLDIEPNKETQAPDNTYMPGLFDQFDSQLFGKYLPPYMMSEQTELPEELYDVDNYQFEWPFADPNNDTI